MTLNTREYVLAWGALVAILTAVTFYFGEPMYETMEASREDKVAFDNEIEIAQRLLDRKEGLDQQLEELLSQLPHYRPDQDINSQLLKKLQRTADEHGLILVKSQTEKEINVGDLYQSAIRSDWEGTLDALVKFLYALQSEGVIVDVQRLTASPSRSKAGSQKQRLKGSLTIDFAYSRDTTDETADEITEDL